MEKVQIVDLSKNNYELKCKIIMSGNSKILKD